MIKIIMNVRNRLAVTKHAIRALYEHSTLDFQLYIYNNRTNYKLKQHFEYFWKLYEEGLVHQVTFNTKQSVFNAFDKAAALNSFGHNHNQDPRWQEYDYLVFLDNDMIVRPDWDIILKNTWEDINKYHMDNIKIVGQHPGGIKTAIKIKHKIAGYDSVTGTYGGSCFWCVKTNFYRDVGFLDLKPLVGLSKKHDQHYWRLLLKSSGGKHYILGLKAPMVLNTGGFVGSICNVLSYGTDASKEEKIKFIEKEEEISNMCFDIFYEEMSKHYNRSG